MNSDEVELLIARAITAFVQPDTLRANESIEAALLRQQAALRENLDQLHRFIGHTERYHTACLRVAYRLIQSGRYRSALHTGCPAYWTSRDQ